MEIFEKLFGSGSDLEIHQMVARALAIFVITLGLIRASGRRSFGQRSSFDACITVLLGAVLSRAVVGASPFMATVASAAALVVLHRLVALASLRWPKLENLITGHEIVLVRDGRVDRTGMRNALVTRANLDEAIRQKLGCAPISEVALALLERDGKITVIGTKEHVGQEQAQPSKIQGVSAKSNR